MKEKMTDNKNIIISFLTETFLLGVFVYCFVRIGISTYQVPKDFYYYTGCCSLILLSICLRGLKNLKPLYLYAFAVYIMYFAVWHIRHWVDWGNQYRVMLFMKQMMYGLSGVCVLSMLHSKGFALLNKKDLWYKIIFLGVGGLSLIIGGEYLAVIIVPVLIWYTTPMTSETWKKLLAELSVAVYIVFFLLMSVSIVFMPNLFGGRFVGCFVYPAAAGTMTSLALLSVLFIYDFYLKERKKIIRIIVAGLLFLYPSVIMFVVLNRSAMLGVLLVCVALYIFCAKENRRKKALKRGLIILSLFVFFIAVGLILIKILQNIDLSALERFVEDKDQSPAIYVVKRFLLTLSDESRTGLFEGGTLINAMDALSSTRVSIWWLGLKNFKVFGGSELSITLPDGDFVAHTHSTYLDWLLRLGIVGFGMVGWIFSYTILSAKKVLKENRNCLFALMWAFYCIGFFFTERVLCTELPFFLLMLLQYPMLMEFKEEVL